jgi:hypothetical protein
VLDGVEEQVGENDFGDLCGTRERQFGWQVDADGSIDARGQGAEFVDEGAYQRENGLHGRRVGLAIRGQPEHSLGGPREPRE